MEKDLHREETDASLRSERKHVDRTLHEMRVAERAADKVVDLARSQADAVVVAARDKADQDSQSDAIEQSAIDDGRALADDVVHGARASADDLLRREREEYRDALSELLPLARQNTDRDLLTERVRSDEAIAHRDDFLGIVSHDLRNLLGGIVMSASTLSKDGVDVDEQKRMVAAKRIQLYAARMNRLIGDLVDVVSIDAGKLTNTIVPGDPRALIAETLETFRRSAEENGVRLESEITGTLPRTAFDHDRILQVLANLVANAIKFTSQGGMVYIRGERIGNEAHFSVSDTGPGIREDMHDAVFRRFWQGAQNDRRGSGLGLYICKSIIEAHRGRIWIESTVGQGSVFHFTVPTAP